MKDDVLYPYVLIILFFSFFSSLVSPFHSGVMILGGTILAAMIIFAFSPVSWAVYYVAWTRGARFSHRDLLIGYEAILIIISLLGPGVFGSLGFAASFVVLNLVNPLSWIIIYFSIERASVSRRTYTGPPRPTGNFGSATPAASGSSSMASPVHNQGSGQQSRYENQTAPSPGYSGQASAIQAPPRQNPTPVRQSVQRYSGREAFGDDITLVGYVGGGKTTFTALFVYACQFIRGIPNFRFVLEESSPLVRSALGQLLSGDWPSLTLRSEYRTQTRIVLSRKKNISTRKVNLTMNDVSGEIWREIAEQADNPSHRLAQLVRENPSVISLQRASKYLITINCADFAKWDSEQLSVLDLFRAIRAINGGKKVRKPAAVIFTKLDLLPQTVREKPAEMILREHLPYVYSYLEEHYDVRTTNFFKVGLRINDFEKPEVSVVGGKKRLTIIGGGNIGAFPEIVRWMLSD